MAKIDLVETGFKLISKGWHVFKIESVDYKEKFGKLEVTMVTKEGDKHIERFSLIDSKGKVNEGAQKAFSYFAKVALQDSSLDSIDDQDLVGCFIKCKVEHTTVESNKDPDKEVTFIKLTEKEETDGFDDTETEDEDDIDWDNV